MMYNIVHFKTWFSVGKANQIVFAKANSNTYFAIY